MRNFNSKHLALIALAGLGAAPVFPDIASAQPGRRAPARHDRMVMIDCGPGRPEIIVIDRSRPGWRRNNNAVVGMAGGKLFIVL